MGRPVFCGIIGENQDRQREVPPHLRGDFSFT